MRAILRTDEFLPAGIAPEGAQSLDKVVDLLQRYLGCEAVVIAIDNPLEPAGSADAPRAVAAFRKGSRIADRAKCDVPALVNPLVAGSLGMRFFAGLPLHDHQGGALGMLAAMDRKERNLPPEGLATLRQFADLVADICEMQQLCQAA